MKKVLTLLLTASLILSSTLPALAREGGLSSDVMNEVVEQSSILLQLKEKLAQIQYRYTLLKENLEVAQRNLDEANDAILNLEGVLNNLDAQLKDARHQSINVKSQKESQKMDLATLEKEAGVLSDQLEEQKRIVSQLMMLLYVKRGAYYDENGVNPVKVLASPGSVSETLQQVTYLDWMEEESRVQMEKMKALSEELQAKWGEIRNKQEELDALDGKLSAEVAALQKERDAQQALYDETVGERTILEAMLSTTDTTESDLESQIRIYQSNIQMIEENLASQGGLLTEDQRTSLEQIQSDMAASYTSEEAAQFLQLSWPVPSTLGISAFFHDGGYAAEFGVDHYALDVRQKQGSEIHAPAEGVVQSVIFDPNSTRYAYIMIAHRMGVMTLYGHISTPAVAIGDYVTRGQLIGYTGGDPGSVGSGARTTGPHLHFEVWQDGVRVDPLKYLPLDELNVKNLPAEYMKQIQKALESQIRNY